MLTPFNTVVNKYYANYFFLPLQHHLVIDSNIILSACPHTGNPKGVMLTHGNVVADFSGFLKVTDVSDAVCCCTTVGRF